MPLRVTPMRSPPYSARPRTSESLLRSSRVVASPEIVFVGTNAALMSRVYTVRLVGVGWGRALVVGPQTSWDRVVEAT